MSASVQAILKFSCSRGDIHSFVANKRFFTGLTSLASSVDMYMPGKTGVLSGEIRGMKTNSVYSPIVPSLLNFLKALSKDPTISGSIDPNTRPLNTTTYDEGGYVSPEPTGVTPN